MAKILIVDNNYSDCLLVESILKKDEHEILSINDGIYVLDTVKSFCPDIIILDLDLDGYSGIDVCYDIRAIKELDDTIILFLTVANDFESIQEAFKAGANDYTIKPINSLLFIHRVRSMLKEAESRKKLNRLNKKYNSIINALPDLVWTVNEENVVTTMYIPAEFSTLLANEDDYVGKYIGEYLPNELTKMCIESIKEARETNKVVTIFYPLDVNDNLTWEDSRFIRINGDVLCVTRNMTSLVEAKIDLNNALAKLRALVNSIPDPIWVVNRSGTIEESYNTQDDAKHIKNVLSNCCKNIGKAIFDAVERAIDTKEPQQFIYDINAIDKYSYDVRVTYVSYNVALVIVRDISYLCETKTSIDKATTYIDESSKLVDEIKRMTMKMIVM